MEADLYSLEGYLQLHVQHIVFLFNLDPVWEFFITLISLWWFGQFIKSRQLFLEIKLIAFLYMSNSKCMRTSIMEFPDWVQVKVKTLQTLNSI